MEISVCPLGVRTAFQLGVGDFKFFICRGVAQHTDAALIELFDRNWQKHSAARIKRLRIRHNEIQIFIVYDRPR